MNWSLFWTATTAIGELLAAGATVWVVIVALRQGRAGKEQYLQARYDDARPVLIIISGPEAIPVQQGNDVYLDWTAQAPALEVRNVGNGVALNVRSVIYGPEALAVADSSTLPDGFTWRYLGGTPGKEEKEQHWYRMTTSVINQGEPEKLQYALAGPLSPIKFAEANMFIEKGRAYRYPFHAPKHPLSQSSAKAPWHLCRVILTYHDIFHRKHASIYDLVFRQGWQTIALLDGIDNDLDDLVG